MATATEHGASISLGDRVAIVGLKKPRLNGLIGKVVKKRSEATGRTYDVRLAHWRTQGVLRKVHGTHLSKVGDTSMLVSPKVEDTTATEHGASFASATADGTSAVTATELWPDDPTVDLFYDLLHFSL